MINNISISIHFNPYCLHLDYVIVFKSVSGKQREWQKRNEDETILVRFYEQQQKTIYEINEAVYRFIRKQFVWHAG